MSSKLSGDVNQHRSLSFRSVRRLGQRLGDNRTALVDPAERSKRARLRSPIPCRSAEPLMLLPQLSKYRELLLVLTQTVVSYGSVEMSDLELV